MDIERYMGVVIALLVALCGTVVVALAVGVSSLLWLGAGLLLFAMGAYLVLREWSALGEPRSRFTGRRIRPADAPEPPANGGAVNGENPRR